MLTDSVKTAAIRMAYTEMSTWVLSRPYSHRTGSGLGPASIVSRLAEVTAPMKSIARKSSPLPRNTVENSRSSISPSWSRTTPMNQRKAMPANGIRWRPSRISLRRLSSDCRSS